MEYLIYFIKPLLFSLIMFGIGASIRKAPQKTYRGKHLLRQAGPITGLMWVCLLLPLGGLLGLAFSDERGDITTWLLFLLVGGPFLAFGIYLLRYKRNHEVLYDDRRLEITDSSGKKTVLEWSAIKSVSFSPTRGFLYIESETKRLKVSNTLKGFQTFLNDLQRLTGHKTSDFRSPYM